MIDVYTSLVEAVWERKVGVVRLRESAVRSVRGKETVEGQDRRPQYERLRYDGRRVVDGGRKSGSRTSVSGYLTCTFRPVNDYGPCSSVSLLGGLHGNHPFPERPFSRESGRD